MTDMKISVIIPTYKPGEYIWECLYSLAYQTFPKEDFEVIIILNGCTEPWKEAIEDYLASHMSDVNVNFIHTVQGGVSNARNLGLEAARGEYITFIDDDDYVSESYLEELYDKASPSVVSLSYPLAFTDGMNQYFPYRITHQYDECAAKGRQPFQKARKFFSGPVYKLIHRDIIGERRFDVNFSNGEDSLFMFEISDKVQAVDFTSRNAIYYRRIRNESANNRLNSVSYRLSNVTRMIMAYSRCYFNNPGKYKAGFYLTRVLASIKSLIYV